MGDVDGGLPTPKASLLVAVSGNGAHAENTLVSLSVRCQRAVSADDYEIIVVERPSTDMLGAERAGAVGPNVRYASFEGEDQEPMALFRAAYESSRAPLVGFVESGTILTPRLLEHAIQVPLFSENPLIVVPTYELGGVEVDGVKVETAAEGLRRVDWREDAYELLPTARFSSENANGYLSSLLQSETFLCRRTACEALQSTAAWGRARTSDASYARLLASAESRLVVLGGEGAFRQDTRNPSDVNVYLRADREPLLFGTIPGHGREFLRVSIANAAFHHALAKEAGADEWPLDRRAPLVTSSRADGTRTPKISIVVVVYAIPRQAENTIYSLSARHQWNVREEDYEIIVVENLSSSNLGEERATRLGGNVRYFAREERGVSPAPAVNFGVKQARAPALGIMIDGARMVTPRVVEYALGALRIGARPVVVVPGYHLGRERQFLTAREGYDEAAEQRLLRTVDWKRAGHELFDIACLDDTTLNGFLNPLLESTCLFCPRESFDAVGGVDERFDLAGGGIVNLDLFDLLCRLEGTRLVVLWSEGAFHQYHGGTSSKSAEDRDALLESFRDQYQAIRGRPYATWDREPTLIGSYVGPHSELFQKSAYLGTLRHGMVRAWGRAEWPND